MFDRNGSMGTNIHDGTSPHVYFGGPDMQPRILRDLLAAHVDAVPSGGEIIWSTYYFRDLALAQALIAASDRGVRVCLHVEGSPRRKTVNNEVIALLRAHELNGGLHIHQPRIGMLAKLHPHLHSKIYYFSHPSQHALIGSFNPSGNEPEDPAVIAEIGDQDRGHNLLVEFSEFKLVSALRAHVLGLDRFAIRFRTDQNKTLLSGQTSAWFYPRLCPAVIERHLDVLDAGDSIKGAISHLKKGFFADSLIRAARRNVLVRLLVHDTERRVPGQIIADLTEAGVDIARYIHPAQLPLHAKFLLVETKRKREAYFGSFNYNPRSRYMNNEILIKSGNETLFDCLHARFDQIVREAQTQRQM